MDIVYEEKIEKKIAKMQKMQGRHIIMLGCEERCIKLYQRLKKEGVNIYAFLKNDSNIKTGEMCQGKCVINVEGFKTLENIVILTFEDQEDIADDLAQRYGNIEIITVPEEKSMELLEKRDKIVYIIKKIGIYQSSYRTYKHLIQKYRVKKILVFSGQSGDLFNALVYLKEYVRAVGMENQFLLTVVGEPCYKVAKMFDISCVEKVNLLETKKLIYLYELCGKKINILPVHSSEAHVKNTVYTKLIRRKNITLGKMYKYQSFLLNTLTKPQLPEYIRNSSYVKEMFEKEKYPVNRTVLVSPYANSYMDDGILKEWENFCTWLKKNGYKVLTNCGNESEQPIAGTEGVFIPLEYIVDFIEHAGWFVGIRSGLCDIICGAQCKKIIFYKEDIYGRGDYTSFHSLKGMELCDDAIELKYCRENQKVIFESIREYFL